MSNLVGQKAPDFKATAVVKGEVVPDFTLSQFEGKKYSILFFYPLDFTFVCPTELHEFQGKLKEFNKMGAEVIACSTDSHFSHAAWLNTPKKTRRHRRRDLPHRQRFPKDHRSRLWSSAGGRHGAARDFHHRQRGHRSEQVVNNLPLGRSIDETLRTLKALQHVEEHGEVCPANWNEGAKAMKPSEEGLKEYFGK